MRWGVTIPTLFGDDEDKATFRKKNPVGWRGLGCPRFSRIY
jgi:hypothetical protein